MATQTPAKKSGRSYTQTPQKAERSRMPLLIGIVVAVIVVAFAAAVIASRGGSDDASQTAAVEVDGAPLPQMTDGDDPALGMVAPTVVGTDFDGETVEITPGDGPRLVVFLAHWCPHCQAEVPIISPYLASDVAPEGLQTVAVSTAVSSSRDNYPPSAWLEREGWPTPVIRDDTDDTVAKAYGLTAYPFFVVINEEGAVVGRDSGEMPVEEFDAFLRNSLGMPLATADATATTTA
ncbi:MAG TPA: TlpA disulfide reductase family protein [Acidimicrobiales bacterium]|jgi:thiol-disulfide isomerase/thioredoxin|nr:TlpA disulfide reductase family protein [Acidimicrobiales bacterium]